MKRKLLLLAATFLMAAFMLSRLNVLTAFADCGQTDVNGDGVSCSNSGSTTGTDGDSDSGEDNGEDGQPGDTNNNDGNDSDDGNNNGGNVDNGSCSPGTVGSVNVYGTVGSSGISSGAGDFDIEGLVFQLPDGTYVDTSGIPGGMCALLPASMDVCTGEILDTSVGGDDGTVDLAPCPTSSVIPDHPCDEFIVSGGGVTCVSDLTNEGSSGSSWEVRARAGWPGIEIHARPFPATLVDWDTVMRVAGLGSSSGSGHLAYAPWGGGSNGSPAAGDWRDVVLRLEIKPLTSWADVFLENIGLIRMPVGQLHTFQWNLPSHPAAGGGPLAVEVGQLEELEPDTPLFSNWTRAPYMVYCTLEYYEWESSCEGGPDENGNTNCQRDSNGTFTGHREWGWKRHSQTVPIPPTAARVDVPASLLADLNGDGVPDAYWGHTTFVRRMDDAGNVDNPEWAHSYSWPGPYWYWAVREAQGQVGWPGVSP
jgi:hypothetical protein